LAGSNHVNPGTEHELKTAFGRYGSPEKHSRVDRILNSQGMQGSLAYQDNDISHGLVDAKATNRSLFGKTELRKETWRPKTTLRWTEEKKVPLSLQ